MTTEEIASKIEEYHIKNYYNIFPAGRVRECVYSAVKENICDPLEAEIERLKTPAPAKKKQKSITPLKKRRPMKFLPGNKIASGRPPGTPNQTSADLREAINCFLDEKFKTITEDFKTMDPRDRIRLYTDLLQYAVPKLQAVSVGVIDRLNNAQLDEIINQLIQANNAKELPTSAN